MKKGENLKDWGFPDLYDDNTKDFFRLVQHDLNKKKKRHEANLKKIKKGEK